MKSAIYIGLVSAISVLLFFFVLREGNLGSRTISSNQTLYEQEFKVSEESRFVTSRARNTRSVDAEIDGANSLAGRIFNEVKLRLEQGQKDEALNELNAMLENFDSLTLDDKVKVLQGYSAYFSRLRQFEDAMFINESILQLPGLNQENRLAYLQLLARYASYLEDWDKFLAFNDQYFDEGGEYTWIVAGNLMRAYQRLEDPNAQGQSLLLHFETGPNPRYDGTEQEYYESFGDIHSLPLSMNDSSEALKLAQALVAKFDGIDNWRVLAEVLRSQGDQSALDEVMNEASNRGLLNAEGNWLAPTRQRSRRLASR